MGKQKTLRFDWAYGKEELTISVAPYQDGGGLYIGLWSGKGKRRELFDDLTVNLPFGHTDVNEAYIKDDFSKEKLAFIRTHELGIILPEVGYSGFCEYAKVAFDLDRLAEFDSEGVRQYRKLHGILEEKEANRKTGQEVEPKEKA